MRRSARVPRGRRAGVAVLTAALVVTACTGEAGDSVPTLPTTTTEPLRPRADDGVLRIGALIPMNDPTTGANIRSSFEQAIQAVNEAGGVLGRDVEALFGDEGVTVTAAASATEALVADGADAIVGPTSSNTAIGALDEATAAGVVTCSATATAISLDDFPDEGLFFRSIATDSLQARAVAREAQSRGSSRVVIVHVDDAYGRPYADAVSDALAAEPSIQVTTVAVPFGDDDLTNDIDDIALADADTAIVLGSGADIARFLEAINDREDIDFRRVIVNDAARDQSSRAVIAGLDAALRSRIVGVAPQVLLPESDDGAGSEEDLPFAPQVTDCVNLIALAAAQGESDSPGIIASQMASVSSGSSGGEECRTFAACVAQLDDDEQIDYDGPTQITELARDGDPSRAFFDRFVFDDDGLPAYDSNIAIP